MSETNSKTESFALKRRPLSNDERKYLEGVLPSEKAENIGTVFNYVGYIVGFTVAVGGIGYLIADRLFKLSPVGILLAVIPLAIVGSCFGTWCARANRQWEELFRNTRLKNDLQEGEVEELQISTNRVIALAPFEFEDNEGYFFDLGKNRLVYIETPDYGFGVAEKKRKDANFPNSSFQLTRCPKSKIVLDLQCSGEELTPVKVLKADDLFETASEFEDVELVEDGKVLEGTLDNLKKALRQWYESQVSDTSN